MGVWLKSFEALRLFWTDWARIRFERYGTRPHRNYAGCSEGFGIDFRQRRRWLRFCWGLVEWCEGSGLSRDVSGRG